VRERIDGLIDNLDGPLAFRLDVGLDETADPLWERDLDNYLYPIARDLPARVVSVWGTKTRSATSSVRLEQARERRGGDDGGAWQLFPVEPAQSADSSWKVAVRAAVKRGRELPPGPVGLEVAFTLGRASQWPIIWKPTIDGLEPLLGRTYADRDWNPQDGRIVRLGLHRYLDPGLGQRASATIRAMPALSAWPELEWFEAMSPSQRSDHLARHTGLAQVGLPAAPLTRARSAMKGLTDEPGVSVFIDDDDGYARWLLEVRDGFVVNVPRSGNGDLVLHRAGCYTINGSPPRGRTWTGPYFKACGTTVAALERWTLANAGTQARPCGTCAPR
jgi:hypothetical protein